MGSDLADYLLDVPFYLWSSEQFEKEMAQTHLKRLRETNVPNNLQLALMSKEQKKEAEEKGLGFFSDDPETKALREKVQWSELKEFGGPWQFNQIAGWVRVFVEGGALGGHIWKAEGKQLKRKTRRRYRLVSVSNCIAPLYDRDADSITIYGSLLQELQRIGSELKPPRHIDLSTFERLGPYVDWRRLLDESVDR